MGPWAVVLMCVVAVACAFAAVGLWVQARWGYRLALMLLAANLAGDIINATVRGDLRALIGLPIASLLIVYLLTPRVRGRF